MSRAIYLLYLIERAKKCLDFSATLYIIHLFICIIYGGWPSSITWWVVNVTGLALMSLLGEWLCIRRELQEIPITRLRSSKQSFAYCYWSFVFLFFYGKCTPLLMLKYYGWFLHQWLLFFGVASLPSACIKNFFF